MNQEEEDAMTEDEWQKSTNPTAMLRSLGAKANRRDLILTLCACGRRLERFLMDDRSRHAFDVAERAAEGKATGEELTAAHEAASEAIIAVPGDSDDEAPYLAAIFAADTLHFINEPTWDIATVISLLELATNAAADLHGAWTDANIQASDAEAAAQAEIIRRIFPW
jgi:hypothetical protein